MEWNQKIATFIKLANKYNVKMILVGGGAVSFHGYQRHSADVDFWIETTKNNFDKLVAVFNEMGFEIKSFPEKVKQKLQNISVKFSPVDLDLELITNFSVNKDFEAAYQDAETVTINQPEPITYRVISYEDLITSKIKSDRVKDLLDIQQLKKIKNQ